MYLSYEGGISSIFSPGVPHLSDELRLQVAHAVEQVRRVSEVHLQQRARVHKLSPQCHLIVILASLTAPAAARQSH